jgi:hypothetical protein
MGLSWWCRSVRIFGVIGVVSCGVGWIRVIAPGVIRRCACFMISGAIWSFGSVWSRSG